MKARVLIVAASLPALALIIALQYSSRRDAPDAVAIEEAPASASPATADGEVPDWVREPLRFDDDADSANAFVFDRNQPTIEEAGAEAEVRLRLWLEEQLPRGLGTPGVVSEEAARQFEALQRYQSDPAWPTVPAVPSVNGFNIRVCPDFQHCLSDQLASEPDDPAWARPMESRLLAEVANHASGGLPQLHVVCRRTICGVLLPSVPDAARLNTTEMAARVAEELGFEHYRIANRDDFQAIYLTIAPELPLSAGPR